jgi:hypothetical protein
MAINDAMVNIRATLDKAYQEGIITLATKESLIGECKRQFYPYRSLAKSVLKFRKDYPDDCEALSQWLSMHGLVDIKKQDAQLVLAHVQASMVSGTVGHSVMPVTKFIASLVDDAELEPLDFQAEWLPEKETKIHALSQEDPAGFRLVKIVATFIKILFSIAESRTLPLDNDLLLEYIRSHALYSPENDFGDISQDLKFSRLYALISQLICQGHIKEALVSAYVPVAAFYFQLEVEPLSDEYQRLLRIIIVCISAAHTHLEDNRLKIKPKVLADHLRDLRLWPRLTEYNAAHPTSMINEHTLIQFIALYMQVTYVYQGTRDTIDGAPETPHYFNWLYDAYDFYQMLQDVSVV